MPLKNKYAPVKSFIFHGIGGAAHGVIGVVKARHIEQRAGLPLAELFDVFAGESAAAFTVTVALTPDPDKPGKPKYSMTEYADMFFDCLPRFLPHTPGHYGWQLANYATGSRWPKKIHYDPRVKTHIMEKFIGDIRLDQALKTVFIPSQKISPGPMEAYDFYHVRDDLLRPGAKLRKTHPETPLPFYKATLASSAFPTVFPAYAIKETGTHHIDSAHVEIGVVPFFMTLKDNLRRDRALAYVRLCNGNGNRPIDPETYNRNGLPGMLTQRWLISMPSHQVHSRTMECINRIVPKADVHVLDRSLIPATPEEEKRFPSLDILDTSPGQIRKLIAFAEEEIEQNRDAIYDPLIDRLLENHARAHAPDMSTAFSMRLTPGREWGAGSAAPYGPATVAFNGARTDKDRAANGNPNGGAARRPLRFTLPPMAK